MKRFLVKYSDNWADEMDIDGCVVITEEQYNKIQENLKSFKPFTFSIGTNEEIEYETLSSLKRKLEFLEIAEEEYSVIEKLELEDMGFAGRLVNWYLLEDNFGMEDWDDEDDEEDEE